VHDPPDGNKQTWLMHDDPLGHCAVEVHDTHELHCTHPRAGLHTSPSDTQFVIVCAEQDM
jgi:hypothetical protein